MPVTGNFSLYVLSASTLIGDEVCTPEGEHLGTIKEIMLDLNTGHVAYAVLSFGGFLGLGDKLFALPWEALTINTDRRRFELDVDKELLKVAPGFDEDKWPLAPDRDFIEEIYAYYGYEPYYERFVRPGPGIPGPADAYEMEEKRL